MVATGKKVKPFKCRNNLMGCMYMLKDNSKMEIHFGQILLGRIL